MQHSAVLTVYQLVPWKADAEGAQATGMQQVRKEIRVGKDSNLVSAITECLQPGNS